MVTLIPFAPKQVAEEICLSITIITAWFYFLHLVRCFLPDLFGLGAFIVMISDVISFDLILFLGLYIVILVSFGSGMSHPLS